MTDQLTYRSMTREDGPDVLKLLWIIFEDMELPLLSQLPAEQIQSIMLTAMQDDTYRYSPTRALVAESNGQIAGAVFSYPGIDEPVIDQPFNQIAEKVYHQSIVMFEDAETKAGEYYVDSLIVHPSFRGRGIGESLLMQAKQLAQRDGYQRLDLNCDINNPRAKKLYERLGFKATERRQISGHWYDLMTYIF